MKITSLAQRLSIQFTENVFSFGISLIVQVLIVSQLGPQEFAYFNYFFLLIMLSSNFLDFGVSDLIIKKRYFNKRTPLVFFIASCLVSIVFSFLLLCGEFLISQFGDFNKFGIPLIIYLGLAYFLVINGFMTYLLRSYLFVKQIAVVRIVSLIFLCIAIQSLPQVLNSYDVILLAYLVSEVIRFFLLGIVIARMSLLSGLPKTIRSRFSLEMLRTIYQASYGFHMMRLFGYFSRNADIYLAGIILPGIEFAKYALAFRLLGAPVRQVSGTLNKVIFPEYARFVDSEKINLFKFSFPAVVNFSFFVFGLVGVNLTTATKIFHIGEWQGISDILVPVALACAFLVVINYTESFIKSVLSARDLTLGAIARTVSTAAIFFVGLNVSLIFAVWALIVAYIIQLLILFKLAARAFSDYAPFVRHLLISIAIFALYASLVIIESFGANVNRSAIIMPNVLLLIFFVLLDILLHNEMKSFSFVKFIHRKLF